LAGRREIKSTDGAQPPFVDLAIKLNADDLADDFINDYFDNDNYIMLLANETPSTRHQAGMSMTMPNTLCGMYLLITALRGKWSRSIGTKTNAR
jgi:hypothetical protein